MYDKRVLYSSAAHSPRLTATHYCFSHTTGRALIYPELLGRTAHCREFCFFNSLQSSALPHWRCRSAAQGAGDTELQRCVPSAGCSEVWPGLSASPLEERGRDVLCSRCSPVAPKCEAPSGQIPLLLLCAHRSAHPSLCQSFEWAAHILAKSY